MKDDSLEEYTLLCSKRIMLSEEESDYFKDELTPMLQACIEKCPDKMVGGRVSHCPFLMKNWQYTLICGKVTNLTPEKWEYFHEIERHLSANLGRDVANFEACVHYCPEGKTQELEKCSAFSNALKKDKEWCRNWEKQLSERDKKEPKKRRG